MSCCADSQSVVLFADADRNNGPEIKVFDTKQAEKVYYFRNYTEVIPTSSPVATIIQESGTILNINNCVDKDLDTFTLNDVDNGEENIIRIDFLTQSPRLVGLMFSVEVGPNDTATPRLRWAGSDLVFSPYEIIVNGSPSQDLPKTTYSAPFGEQDLRYVEMAFNSTSGEDFVMNLYEVYDLLEGWGISNVNIQVKNNITGNFLTAATLSKLDASDGSIEILESKTAIQPNNSLTRVQLVNTGKWHGSVGAILVNPKFT